ncbi:hypothetical protein GYMLUDRAFT_51137 [Collybiopsis luxurians FD-317 M1]|uniref:Unplaced genomic scaffold GYMLUscaffold_149, whole genome shotgun sequence n=1 Tax=Collybiopsis luxurians FD-317 M1 TaxID=944289 RepID=A0A0D0BYQ9_9AGAR|nr:hypothetical protein GYMLUDRAFT_51137 [Collybiopsis luxurians FD-317 M1]
MSDQADTSASMFSCQSTFTINGGNFTLSCREVYGNYNDLRNSTNYHDQALDYHSEFAAGGTIHGQHAHFGDTIYHNETYIFQKGSSDQLLGEEPDSGISLPRFTAAAKGKARAAPTDAMYPEDSVLRGRLSREINIRVHRLEGNFSSMESQFQKLQSLVDSHHKALSMLPTALSGPSLPTTPLDQSLDLRPTPLTPLIALPSLPTLLSRLSLPLRLFSCLSLRHRLLSCLSLLPPELPSAFGKRRHSEEPDSTPASETNQPRFNPAIEEYSVTVDVARSWPPFSQSSSALSALIDSWWNIFRTRLGDACSLPRPSHIQQVHDHCLRLTFGSHDFETFLSLWNTHRPSVPEIWGLNVRPISAVSLEERQLTW